MQDTYDVVIVGGGLVGASLAHALKGSGLRVAIVERSQIPADDRQDQRLESEGVHAIALAFGSRQIFAELGLWTAIEPAATPIRRVYVSDQGHLGATSLNASEEGVEALGYIVPAKVLGEALTRELRDSPDIEWIGPAEVAQLRSNPDCLELEVATQQGVVPLRTHLLVASDGVHSQIRERLGIPVTRWTYGQAAVVSAVIPQYPHENTAYERFTESGPLAFLPMAQNRCAVVWTVREEDLPEVLALSNEEFLAALNLRFGYRLGRLERAGGRKAYPLELVVARKRVAPRVALVGNAAHTLHPVAGQGFNLGLRDVAVLAAMLRDGTREGRDPGEARLLRDYARSRQRDLMTLVAFTDGLVRLFSNPLGPIQLGRSLGLTAVALMPPLKHLLARVTMGLGSSLRSAGSSCADHFL